MKPFFELVVVIPVGPDSAPDYLADTIASVRFYTASRCKIILADDPRSRVGEQLAKGDADLDVFSNNQALGKLSGLYFKLAGAFRYVLENYRFSALLRLDDDALIIGPEPQAEAVALFAEHPKTGLAGRHITGRFSPDTFGNIHDNGYPRNTLLAGTCSLKMFRRPRINWTLRKLLLKAIDNGYEIGENIFGGAYFISPAGIQALSDAGYLPHPGLRGAILEEDHLFSLLMRAAGLDLADLGSGNGPFGCVWRGLPASPETLLVSGKKIIHSTRSWDGMGEAEIRAAFRAARTANQQRAETVALASHEV